MIIVVIIVALIVLMWVFVFGAIAYGLFRLVFTILRIYFDKNWEINKIKKTPKYKAFEKELDDLIK